MSTRRTINLTLVINDGPMAAPASATGTAQAAPDVQASEPKISAAWATLVDRLPRLKPVVWLSDMLVPERNSFGVLRLLMALAVLVSHAFFLTAGQNTAEPLYRWTGYTLGQHGVQVFFFLSGILVAQSLLKSESVRDYAIARGLRIFPALIVCVLATAVIAGPWLTTLPAIDYLKDKAVAAYIVKTLSLMTGSAPLPGLFEGSAGAAKGVVNSSLWTLKYEVLCYVALACIGWIAIRTKAYREVAAAAIAGWLALVLVQRVGIEIGSQKPAFEVFRYFALFFGAGVVAFTLRRWLPIHGLGLVPLGALLIACIGTRFAEPAMAVTLGYGALWLATFDFWGLRGYTNHSDYSYGTYIWGMPVSQALLMFVPGMHAVSLALITTGIVLFLAFLSWEAVERPALALRHRFRRNELAAASTKASQTTSTSTSAAAIPAAKPDGVRAEIKPAASAAPGKPGATTTATDAPTPVTVEPGIARRWRPMSSPIRLQVEVDVGGGAPLKATASSETPAAQVVPLAPDVPTSRISLALNRGKGVVPPTGKPANDSHASGPTFVRNATIDEPREPRSSRPRPAWRPVQPQSPTER